MRNSEENKGNKEEKKGKANDKWRENVKKSSAAVSVNDTDPFLLCDSPRHLLYNHRGGAGQGGVEILLQSVQRPRGFIRVTVASGEVLYVRVVEDRKRGSGIEE